MLFNSIDFMWFFPIVLGIYFVIPKKARMYWLLVASYYFYMSWNPIYAILIMISTVTTYGCAIAIEHIRRHKIKDVLFTGIFINITILFIFKYGKFFIETIAWFADGLNHWLLDNPINIILPVGISFYTFQALGYLVDVYRGKVEAERNIFRYALFVSFFPQLVAGPIERSENLLLQMNNIEKMRLWNAHRVTSGAIMMVWGFFMKMVIADRLAVLVNYVFDNYRMLGSTELITGAIAFSIQIYCDFGSYSLIAIGSAKILGFDLMENFNAPYFAENIQDFWSRWHISLSTWFKDYVYIPLGGNRKGNARKYANLMIVFLLSGLWHGANWTFVVWGGLHGLFRIVSSITYKMRKKVLLLLKVNTDCFSWKLLKIICTYALVTFSWIFFRADSLKDALRYIYRILIKPTPELLFNGGIFNLGLNRPEMNILMFAIILLFLVDYIKMKKNLRIDELLMNQNLWFEWGGTIILLLMIFAFGEYGPTFDAQQFIYFQF